METRPADSSLLQAAERRLRRLSLERLRVADDFLAYLEEREESEATQELLGLPDFEDAFRRAVQQARVGQVVSFEDIRRDVSTDAHP
jgi:lipase chaperone LimK